MLAAKVVWQRSLVCKGDAVWQAARAGRWSRDLAEAAYAQIPEWAGVAFETIFFQPTIFLVEYRDGFRGTVLMRGGEDGNVETFAYAARVGDEVQACQVFLGGDPHPHFSYLSLNVQEMFLSGQPTWPVERTLLTTGVLEAALESRYRGHQRVETPHLAVNYRSYTSFPHRPTGPRPTGAAATPWPKEA